MAITNRLKNQHLLWRAAFGPMAENVADLDAMTPKALWVELVKTSGEIPVEINVSSNPFTNSTYMNADGTPMNPADLDKDQKKLLIKQKHQRLNTHLWLMTSKSASLNYMQR